jgi:hypothetical protein
LPAMGLDKVDQKRKMKFQYPLKHWLTTMLLGPTLMIGYDLVSTSKLMVDAFGLFLLFVAFGLLFSLPVFLLYLWTFNRMTTRKNSDFVIKAALDLGGVIAIAVMFLVIIKGTMSVMLTFCYSIALIISSLFFRIGDKKLEWKDTID